MILVRLVVLEELSQLEVHQLVQTVLMVNSVFPDLHRVNL